MQPTAQSLSQTFAATNRPATGFQYGWCYTDWKDGKNIAAEHRLHDYFTDEPYASLVKNMLEKLGLPMPQQQEIYRGTHHDLLFLNSHGLVLRIGPFEAEDLMNPGFLQPLGWLETDVKIKNVVPKRFHSVASQKETNLAVAIYPGIELYESWNENKNRAPKTGSLKDFLVSIGQATFDLSDPNKGMIRVLTDDGKEAAVEVLADAENEWNTSVEELSQRRNESLRKMEQLFPNKADAIAQMMQEIFGSKDTQLMLRAFEAHQPLRRLFWEAFGNKSPDPASRDNFWNACAQVTNNPQSAIMPTWQKTVGADGSTAFTREETYIPHVVLYRQWTKLNEDRVIYPIQQSPELIEAVKKAHAALGKPDQALFGSAKPSLQEPSCS